MMERTENHQKIATQRTTTNEEVISISSTEETHKGNMVEELTLSSGSNEESNKDMDIESEYENHETEEVKEEDDEDDEGDDNSKKKTQEEEEVVELITNQPTPKKAVPP